MNKKKQIFKLTISIILVVIVFTSSAYALWISTKNQESTNYVVSDCLSLTLEDATEISNININSALPDHTGHAMSNDDSSYSFTIKNNCDTAQDYVIGLENITNTNNVIPYSTLSYAIDGMAMGSLASKDFINTKTAANEEKELYYGTIPAKSGNIAGSVTHTFKLWVNETATANDSGKTFSSKIFVSAGQDEDGNMIESKKYLAQMMKNSADTETVIDFTKTSAVTSTNGIYAFDNTEFGNTIYYYRGNVNNNLIFAGKCWRIIRTTDTGGVKILYNGDITDGECLSTNPLIGRDKYNEYNNDATYIGYMISSTIPTTSYAQANSNEVDSNVKSIIDEWYEENILNTVYHNYIEDTIYCNDRNLISIDNDKMDASFISTMFINSSADNLGYGLTTNIYAATTRASYYGLTAEPSLSCVNTTGLVGKYNDAFTVSRELGNGKLTYPVGLITNDELSLSGLVGRHMGNQTNYTNNDVYTKLVGISLTMSPLYETYAPVVRIGTFTSGSIDETTVTTPSSMINPVVSLNPGTIILSGTGTSADPYIITE